MARRGRAAWARRSSWRGRPARHNPGCEHLHLRCLVRPERWPYLAFRRSAARGQRTGPDRGPERRLSRSRGDPGDLRGGRPVSLELLTDFCRLQAMELPPGPHAPVIWQTIAWMTRPGAFMRAVHTRYGDPATIRTYWTEEPMVLFSSPDAVRAVFRLDPAIAPAGQSWEFLRPFAGQHSILLLDGEEHMRERRAMSVPFHGDRMRAFEPLISELARR